MNTPRYLLSVGLMSVMSAAAAQTYGPQDEGRRFDDGSRVVCKNVEVRQNSRDPNRVAGTAIGAVIGGLRVGMVAFGVRLCFRRGIWWHGFLRACLVVAVLVRRVGLGGVAVLVGAGSIRHGGSPAASGGCVAACANAARRAPAASSRQAPVAGGALR